MLATTSTSLLNSVLNSSAQKSAAAAACANAAKISSNNLLSSSVGGHHVASDNYDSPTLINSSNAQAITTNHRLSTNRNNISHNNLSTSASLLDATADDAMSSMAGTFPLIAILAFAPVLSFETQLFP